MPAAGLTCGDGDRLIDPQPWRQVDICFDQWATAERAVVTHIAPILVNAETAGLIRSWFFVRKAPHWRTRFLPVSTNATAEATTFIHQRLDRLRQAGLIAGWTETIYEPETHAFGGTAGMDAAHWLFHQDSYHILTHLCSGPEAAAGGGDQRRETTLLLCSVLLRSSRQDWYEQGDVWARVAEHRTLPSDTPPDRLHTLRSELNRLLTVDTTALTQVDQPLAHLGAWVAAFEHAGGELADLARNGTLNRGLRAVLAHHILFAWNRIGLPHATQAVLAATARNVIFNQ